MTRGAVERNLERASEASRHIPFRDQGSAQGHRLAVAGRGNVLRHDDPRVKDPRVWQIVSNDLPPLKAERRRVFYGGHYFSISLASTSIYFFTVPSMA